MSGAGVLVLAPTGRDAAACVKLVAQVGLDPHVCGDVGELLVQLARGADLALIAEEALYGKPMDRLVAWVDVQPPWSDFPFIVITNQNEGARFTAFRRRVVGELRNVSFLERPMQAISLQAAVLSAKRGRLRQYKTRSHLEAERHAAENLERLVAERTRALRKANEQLREENRRRERAQAALLQAQKLETMGQLVGGVAHDFNNLLMAVIGNLELLAKKIDGDPRQAKLLHGAMEGAQRGAALTQRLLAFARKQELQSRATDINVLIQDMRDLIVRSIGPLITVQIRASNALPNVDIDPNQLEMALLNLAVNARDAMPTGGALTISMEQSAATAEQPDLPPRRLRADFGTRHRGGHGCGNAGPRGRAIFFHEGHRQGHGAGAFDGSWPRRTVRRRIPAAEQPGRGDPGGSLVAGVPAGVGAARAARAGAGCGDARHDSAGG
jgi:signal transduction histidine kinase